jgi:hypothetical protein
VRPVLVLVGMGLIIIGVVLAAVPLFPQPRTTLSSATPTEAFNVTAAFSLTGTVPVTVAWRSSATVSVFLAACDPGPSTSGPLASGPLCPGAAYQIQNGTHGTASLNVKPGGILVVALNPSGGNAGNATATVDVTSANPVLGTLLLGIGIVVLVVGAFLRRRPAASSPTASPGSPVESAP